MPRKNPHQTHTCERCGETKHRSQMRISSSGRATNICLACQTPPTPDVRWCTAHKTWEPLENFGTNKARPDGLSAVCKRGKNFYDEKRRAESLAARGEAAEDDIGAMDCNNCAMMQLCRDITSTAYRGTWKDIPPELGTSTEIPCSATSPMYPKYVAYVRAKRAVQRKGHRRVTVTNFVMTVTGD